MLRASEHLVCLSRACQINGVTGSWFDTLTVGLAESRDHDRDDRACVA